MKLNPLHTMVCGVRDPFAISFEVILKSQIEIWDGPPTMLGGPTSFTGKARKISYGGTTIFFSKIVPCRIFNIRIASI